MEQEEEQTKLSMGDMGCHIGDGEILMCLLGDWDFVGIVRGGCVSVGDRGRDKVEVSILYFPPLFPLVFIQAK